MVQKMKIKTQQIKLLITKIKQYKTIVVFRHESPDFDALGSQYGLISWLKDNFNDKKIIGVGITNVDVGINLFKPIPMQKISEPYLAIVLDTANQARISGEEYKKADYIIKIDHHPSNDFYGNLNIIETKASSVGELLFYILSEPLLKKYDFSKTTAYNLMIGLVGDTGRLVFPSTTLDTINAYYNLAKKGIDLQDIFTKMYAKSIDEIKIIKHVYEKLKITKQGLGYFYFHDSDLKKLKIHPDIVVKYLPLLANYQEIKIFASLTEDVAKGIYRISIRSSNVVVNQVAQTFNGGGHKHAAGAKVKNLAETKKLLKALNDLL